LSNQFRQINFVKKNTKRLDNILKSILNYLPNSEKGQKRHSPGLKELLRLKYIGNTCGIIEKEIPEEITYD